MGPKIGQVALRYGCNDFGSIMIEENVVSAAGAHYEMAEADMARVIRDAGFVPARRNVLYELLEAPVVG
jgi:cyclic dehypoxanthinyl futalosine synthase